jgi:uncharacterized protein
VRPAPNEPHYHVGMAIVAWMIAFVVGVIGATLILAAAGYANPTLHGAELAKACHCRLPVGTRSTELPLWLIAVQQIPLWTGLLAGAVVISRRWGTGRLRDDYGLHFRLVDLWGVVIGVVVQLVFLPILYKALSLVIDVSSLDKPAKQLTDQAKGSLGVVLLVAVIVIGAPIVEEIFFRGLVLRSIAARYSDVIALVGSALMFALVHFQALQFAGLALFGLVLAYCAQRTGRLGMGMAAHMAFNATTVVLLLAKR